MLVRSPAAAQLSLQCGDKAYQVTDTLPKLLSDPREVIRRIAETITIPDSLESKDGHIVFKFIINCRGETVKARIVTIYDYDRKPFPNSFAFLAQQIGPVMERNMKWRPAFNAGEKVDFFQMTTISFKRGLVGMGLETRSYWSEILK
jgi:hypothetical protein